MLKTFLLLLLLSVFLIEWHLDYYYIIIKNLCYNEFITFIRVDICNAILHVHVHVHVVLSYMYKIILLLF